MANPNEGDVVDGYRFKGGDPNAQGSWEPVQQQGQAQPTQPASGPRVGDVVDGYRFKGGDPNDQANWGQADEKQRTLLGALGEGALNLPGSVVKNVGQMAEGLGSMVRHPVDTAVTMSKLASSVIPGQQTANTLVLKGLEQMPIGEGAKAWIDNYLKTQDEPGKAILHDYANAYGGWDKFKNTIATDPGRILSDVATVATMGEAGAAKVPQLTGALQKAGVIGAKTAGIADKVAGVGETLARGAQYADPTNLALATVGKAGDIGMGMLNKAGGTGDSVMQTALKTGFEGGEAGEQFRKGLRELPAEDAVAHARAGFDTMKQRMFTDYQADKDLWSKSNAKLNFDKLDDAELAIHNNITSQTGNKLKFKASEPDVNRINQLLEIVDQWRKDPASHTLLGFDDLKQAIRNSINWKSDSSYVTSAATSLANAAKDTAMMAADPAYRRSLARYQQMADKLNDVDKAFSLKSDNLHTTMSKLQSVMRNNANTQYGMRKGAAQTLKEEGGVDVMPMLAGHAASSWAPRGLRGWGFTGDLPLAATAGAFLHPAAALPFVGHMIASSPRLMAETLHGAGRVAGLPGAAYGMLPQRFRDLTDPMLRGAVSQPARNFGAMMDRTGQTPPLFARGGRVAFDDGGDVEAPDDSSNLLSPASVALPMPALRAAVNARAPKTVDPVATILARKVGPTTLTQPVIGPQAPLPKPDTSGYPTNPLIDKGVKSLDKIINPDKDDKASWIKDLKAQLAGLQAGALSRPTSIPTEPSAQGSQYGLPTGALKGDSYEDKVATVESGGNPSAVNPSTGTAGLYQFMPSTAEGIRKAHPELGISDNWRTNADDQKKLMQAFTDANRSTLKGTLNRDPTGGELYLAHFFGAGGAQRILGGLDKPITQVTTDAERAANPIISHFKTGQDMLDYYNKRFG